MSKITKVHGETTTRLFEQPIEIKTLKFKLRIGEHRSISGNN